MDLNRWLVEQLYVDDCPAIGTKVQNMEPVLKYLFVKYLSPFKGREYEVSKDRIYITDLEERLATWYKNHPKDAKVKPALDYMKTKAAPNGRQYLKKLDPDDKALTAKDVKLALKDWLQENPGTVHAKTIAAIALMK
jgi:hypothetical protein